MARRQQSSISLIFVFRGPTWYFPFLASRSAASTFEYREPNIDVKSLFRRSCASGNYQLGRRSVTTARSYGFDVRDGPRASRRSFARLPECRSSSSLLRALTPRDGPLGLRRKTASAPVALLGSLRGHPQDSGDPGPGDPDGSRVENALLDHPSVRLDRPTGVGEHRQQSIRLDGSIVEGSVRVDRLTVAHTSTLVDEGARRWARLLRLSSGLDLEGMRCTNEGES